jgi:hypothetical protein
MVLIVRRENPWAPFVQGLSQGLERFGQMRQEQQRVGNLAKAFESMGYDPQQAQAMAVMPESIQGQFIKAKQKAPAQEMAQSILSKYGLAEQPTVQQSMQAMPQQDSPSFIETLQAAQQGEPSQREELTNDLAALVKQQRQNLMNRMLGEQQEEQPQGFQPSMSYFTGGVQQLPQMLNQDLMQRAANYQYPMPQMQQEAPQVPRDMAPIQQTASQIEQPLQQEPIVEGAQPVASKKPTAEEMRTDALALASIGTPEAIAMSKVLTKKADAQEKRAQTAWDRADKRVNEYVDKEKVAREQLDLVTEMEQLDKTGTLDSPSKAVFAEMVDKITGITGAGNGMLTADSQYFNKVRASLLKGMAKEFGGRVAVQEMDNFMKKFPSLMNSKEGRQKIYELFKVNLDLANIDVQAAQNVIDRNGGYPPDNFSLAQRAEERRLRKELIDSKASEVNQIIGSETKQPRAFSSIPKASDVPKGMEVYDTKTGRIVYVNR